MRKRMDPDPDPQHRLELRQNLDLIVQASYFELGLSRNKCAWISHLFSVKIF